MNIQDVKEMFPDTPIKELDDGFQMLDRPYHPNVIEKMLNHTVKHIGCYVFQWIHQEPTEQGD